MCEVKVPVGRVTGCTYTESLGDTKNRWIVQLVDETTGEAVLVTFRGTCGPISLQATAG